MWEKLWEFQRICFYRYNNNNNNTLSTYNYEVKKKKMMAVGSDTKDITEQLHNIFNIDEIKFSNKKQFQN